MRRLLPLGLLLGPLVAGCGESTATGPTFIAFASHFQGYRTWEVTSIADPGPPPVSSPDGGVDTHFGGPRKVYLNKRASPGAAEYPVGTLLVKDVLLGGGSRTFALAKRSATYNTSGALGWEFFELRVSESGAVTDLKWRGLGPPLGDGDGDPYGVDGGCNACHGAARASDSILTPAYAPR